MPGKDGAYSEEMIKQMQKEYLGKAQDYEKQYMNEPIWVSPGQQEKWKTAEKLEQFQKDLNRLGQIATRKEPWTHFRDEVRGDLKDIRKAIGKLGIMLDCEEPTAEELADHATLREAYRKYKMIEALILGKKK